MQTYLCMSRSCAGRTVYITSEKSPSRLLFIRFRSGINPIVGEEVACNVIDWKPGRMLIAGESDQETFNSPSQLKRFYDSMTFLSVQQLRAVTSCCLHHRPSGRVPQRERAVTPPAGPGGAAPTPSASARPKWGIVVERPTAEGEAAVPLSLPISSVWLWWASLSGWNTRRRVTERFLLLMFACYCS